MRRFMSGLLSTTPFIIIGVLLYAGFFVKPESKGTSVARPVFERGDSFYGVTAVGDANAWLVGSGGKILHSTDSGKTWLTQGQPGQATQTLQDVTAWDVKRIVAVGNGGTVLISHDGGVAWRRASVPKLDIANALLRIKALPNGQAWAVGERGVTIHTSDYGNTWSQEQVGEDAAWNDVFFYGTTVWLVGEFGRVMVSHDTGASWQTVKSPVTASLMSVHFKDPAQGVIVGIGGAILVTTDGGAVWNVAKSPTSEHLFDVTWDGSRWLAVGSKGAVVLGDGDGHSWRSAKRGPGDNHWYTRVSSADGHYFFAGSRLLVMPKNSL